MSRRSHFRILFTSLALIGSASTVRAQDTTLNFTSLPSAQGWLLESNASESSVFSVSSNTLFQTTVGKGATYAWYELDNFADFSKPFTMDLRAAVLSQDNGHVFGFGMQVETATKDVAADISALVSDTQFHNYSLTGDFTTGVFNLSIDGGSNIPLSPESNIGSNTILFGDETPSGSNANVEITQFSFSQDATTPEPGTLSWAFGMGLFGSGLLVRRKRVRNSA